jgi:hypothetical protein
LYTCRQGIVTKSYYAQLTTFNLLELTCYIWFIFIITADIVLSGISDSTHQFVPKPYISAYAFSPPVIAITVRAMFERIDYQATHSENLIVRIWRKDTVGDNGGNHCKVILKNQGNYTFFIINSRAYPVNF